MNKVENTNIYTSIKDQANLPRYFRRIFKILLNLKVGSIEVKLPDERIFKVYGENNGIDARVDIIDPDCFARLVRDGDIGFMEAYMDGQWSSPDLQNFMDVTFQNFHQLATSFPGAGLVKLYEKLRHWLNSNSKRQAKKNISYHYDLGNDFYKLWLDETMTYSSALFKEKKETLSNAQINKYAQMCDEIGVKEGDHILEIGCGTGGNIKMLQQYGNVKAIEMDDFAIEYAKTTGAEIRQGFLPTNFPYEEKYDLICMFDVLEHIEEDKETLKVVKNHLNPNGQLLITVPACQWLYSTHDKLLHHKRRYSKKQLSELASDNNFTIKKLSFFNTLLFPLVIIARILDIFKTSEVATGYGTPSKIINYCFYNIFKSEKKLINKISFPFGTSLIILLS